MNDFAAAVARLRASMGGENLWNLTEPPTAEGPSPELRARRRMGREAYERSMVARGMSQRQARIYASAALIWDDED